MAWNTEMPIILRNIINDYATTPKYTDNRLQQLILVAAQLLQQDLDFTTSYIIDIQNSLLTPDPTITTSTFTRDDAFINLVILRSACVLSMGEFRQAGGGIIVRDMNLNIDTRKNLPGLQLSVKNFCDLYNQAKWEYQTGAGNVGEAVLGPYKYGPFVFGYPNMFFGGNRTNRWDY
jgi:hypothetical protein